MKFISLHEEEEVHESFTRKMKLMKTSWARWRVHGTFTRKMKYMKPSQQRWSSWSLHDKDEVYESFMSNMKFMEPLQVRWSIWSLHDKDEIHAASPQPLILYALLRPSLCASLSQWVTAEPSVNSTIQFKTKQLFNDQTGPITLLQCCSQQGESGDHVKYTVDGTLNFFF